VAALLFRTGSFIHGPFRSHSSPTQILRIPSDTAWAKTCEPAVPGRMRGDRPAAPYPGMRRGIIQPAKPDVARLWGDRNESKPGGAGMSREEDSPRVPRIGNPSHTGAPRNVRLSS